MPLEPYTDIKALPLEGGCITAIEKASVPFLRLAVIFSARPVIPSVARNLIADAPAPSRPTPSLAQPLLALHFRERPEPRFLPDGAHLGLDVRRSLLVQPHAVVHALLSAVLIVAARARCCCPSGYSTAPLPHCPEERDMKIGDNTRGTQFAVHTNSIAQHEIPRSTDQITWRKAFKISVNR